MAGRPEGRQRQRYGQARRKWCEWLIAPPWCQTTAPRPRFGASALHQPRHDCVLAMVPALRPASCCSSWALRLRKLARSLPLRAWPSGPWQLAQAPASKEAFCTCAAPHGAATGASAKALPQTASSKASHGAGRCLKKAKDSGIKASFGCKEPVCQGLAHSPHIQSGQWG